MILSRLLKTAAPRKGQSICCEVMKHPSSQVGGLSRALWWGRWAPKRALLLRRRGALSWGRGAGGAVPSIHPKERKTRATLFLSFPFLLAVLSSWKPWKQLLWARDQHQSFIVCLVKVWRLSLKTSREVLTLCSLKNFFWRKQIGKSLDLDWLEIS